LNFFKIKSLFLENQFVFDDMKSAFALCKKYSKHNSRVKIFANRNDAENFIQQQKNNTTKMMILICLLIK